MKLLASAVIAGAVLIGCSTDFESTYTIDGDTFECVRGSSGSFIVTPDGQFADVDTQILLLRVVRKEMGSTDTAIIDDYIDWLEHCKE